MDDNQPMIELLREAPVDDAAVVPVAALPRVREVRAVLTPLHREPVSKEPEPTPKPALETRLRVWSPPPRKPTMATMTDLAPQGSRRGATSVAHARRRPDDRNPRP